MPNRAFLASLALIFVFLTGARPILAAPSPSKATPTADLTAARALLERSLKSHADSATPGGMPWWYALSHVILAQAALDPQEGFRLVDRVESLGGGSETARVQGRVLEGLARVLPVTMRARLFERARKASPEDRLAIAQALVVGSEAEAREALPLVDPASLQGSMAILTWASDLEARGLDGRPLLALARFVASSSDPKPEEVGYRMLRAWLERDRQGLEKVLRDGVAAAQEDDFLTVAVGLSTVSLRLGEHESRERAGVARFAQDVATMCAPLSDDRRVFTLLGLAAGAWPSGLPRPLLADLQKRWSKRFLEGDSAPTYGATFFALSSAVDVDPEWATTVAEDMVATLMARVDSQQFYHMAGTAAGVVATRLPDRARRMLVAVRTLEWRVNGQRCVYRGWGKLDPKAALEAARLEWPGDDSLRASARADILLEAALGASLTQPLLALQEIEQLPDRPARFSEGLAVVAPPVATVDLDRALRLLTPPPGQPVSSDAAAALAQIILDRTGVDLDPHRPKFYPDRLYPRDRWPGPTLSEPLRF